GGCSWSGCCSASGSCAMSELGELLTAVAQGKAKPVYLIEGDEYLARGAARELSQALVPEKDRALNLVTLDAGAGAREVVSHLVTIAMFAAPDESDKGWLSELSSWAEEQRLSAPPHDLEALVTAVERGLPPRTHLILVAESLPPKHPLVRLASTIGAHLRRRAERRGRGIEA